RSCTLESGRESEVKASVKMGASAGLTLLYTGGVGRSLGRYVCAALIAACTSCSAISMSRVSTNCKVMTELPPELVDVICWSPGTCPNWRSNGAVTDEAMTSGLAPG